MNSRTISAAIVAALVIAVVSGPGPETPEAAQIPLRRDSRGTVIGPNVSTIVQDDGFPLPGQTRRYQPFIGPGGRPVWPTPLENKGCHGGLICSACPSGQHGHPDCQGCRYCSDESRSCANCPPMKRHAWARFVGPPAPN
jgi:hypothetical protein